MDAVYLCPECGSGKVDRIRLDLDPHGRYHCNSCGWQGKEDDLVLAASNASEAQYTEDLLSTPDRALGVAEAISKQYLLVLSEEAAQAVGVAMVRAGIVGGKEDPQLLGRIIRAAILGAHRATLEEVEAIQKEKSDAGRE